MKIQEIKPEDVEGLSLTTPYGLKKRVAKFCNRKLQAQAKLTREETLKELSKNEAIVYVEAIDSIFVKIPQLQENWRSLLKGDKE